MANVLSYQLLHRHATKNKGVWQTPPLQACFPLDCCNKDNTRKRSKNVLEKNIVGPTSQMSEKGETDNTVLTVYYPFPIPHLKDSRTTFKDCRTVFPTLPVCGFCLEASKSSSLIVSKDAPPISIRDTSSHISSGSERDKAYSRAKLVPISYKTAKTD